MLLWDYLWYIIIPPILFFVACTGKFYTFHHIDVTLIPRSSGLDCNHNPDCPSQFPNVGIDAEFFFIILVDISGSQPCSIYHARCATSPHAPENSEGSWGRIRKNVHGDRVSRY